MIRNIYGVIIGLVFGFFIVWILSPGKYLYCACKPSTSGSDPEWSASTEQEKKQCKEKWLALTTAEKLKSPCSK
ncbi:MAG: hypothetical protein HOP04_14595 [Methylophilaceae bacterium]|nr:hypothetical protein [Methylophilaceae bacterium]